MDWELLYVVEGVLYLHILLPRLISTLLHMSIIGGGIPSRGIKNLRWIDFRVVSYLVEYR